MFYSIRQHNFVIKHCCAKLNTFYIVDSVMKLNNTQRTHCFLSIATMVTRTHYNVRLVCICRLDILLPSRNYERIIRDVHNS